MKDYADKGWLKPDRETVKRVLVFVLVAVIGFLIGGGL